MAKVILTARKPDILVELNEFRRMSSKAYRNTQNCRTWSYTSRIKLFRLKNGWSVQDAYEEYYLHVEESKIPYAALQVGTNGGRVHLLNILEV